MSRDVFFRTDCIIFLSLRVRGRSPTDASRNKSISRFRGTCPIDGKEKTSRRYENKIDFPRVYFAPRSKSCSFRTNFRASRQLREQKSHYVMQICRIVKKCDAQRTFPFDFCLYIPHYAHDASLRLNASCVKSHKFYM
jgi:hypothetical protein